MMQRSRKKNTHNISISNTQWAQLKERKLQIVILASYYKILSKICAPINGRYIK
jgi:folate-dependent phosphoribosylglycinamide formyltransferase PurN